MADHGGKREGAGRPKLYDSKRMSVPKQLVPQVKELIDDYRDKMQRYGGKYKPKKEKKEQQLEILPEKQNSKELDLEETINRSVYDRFKRKDRRALDKRIRKGNLRIIEGK